MRTLTDSCPDMDWSAGSIARELIAVPAALLGSVFDKHVQDAYRVFDIQALRNDPENNKETIDKWFAMLNLEDNREQTAYGKLKIYLSTLTNNLVIMKGTVFTVNDVKVSATDTTTWLSANSSSYDGTYPIAYPDGTYSLEINVSATSTASVALAAGTAVSWTSAPSNVTGVYVSSAISGGTTKLTYAEKAEKIFDTLQQPSYSTEANIQALLRNTFPTMINSIKVGRRTSSNTNTVNLYVKPTRAPETFNVDVIVSDNKCRLNGCGIYAVTGVVYDNKPVYDYTVSFDGTVGASDSFIEIAINTVKDGVVTVTCEGFSTLADIHNMLNDVHTLSACSFRLLLPTIAYINIDIQTDDAFTDAAIQDIYDYVNTSTLNTTVLSDTHLCTILKDQGIITKGPTFYTADVVHGTTKHVVTAVGAINVAQLSFDSDVPTACYAFSESVGTI